MMRLFGLKNCDTCRKAIRALGEAGYDMELVDIRQSPLSRDLIDRFMSAFGEALINRRSTTWRNLDEAERAKPEVDLLLAHPALMKRPVIDDGKALTLGWDKNVQSHYLDQS